MTDPIVPEKLADLAKRVQGALAQLRPYLEADAGDITLHEITDDFIVNLKRCMQICKFNKLSYLIESSHGL